MYTWLNCVEYSRKAEDQQEAGPKEAVGASVYEVPTVSGAALGFLQPETGIIFYR